MRRKDCSENCVIASTPEILRYAQDEGVPMNKVFVQSRGTRIVRVRARSRFLCDAAE